jgi:glyoxylase-like metal-dependent hydrolase (beta-lactamase superfamily II)
MSSKVCEGVYLVGGSDLSDDRDCLVYLVDLGDLVLVDCGAGPGWPRIRDNIISAGFNPDRIHTLILTHGHVDHIGAAREVREETRCRLVAHAEDAPFIESGDPDFTASSWYGIRLGKLKLDKVIMGPGEKLGFAGGELELIHTPGHTPGSIVALLEAGGKRVLFGQDIHGPFDPSFRSDLQAWRESMQKILNLQADILCEGHFGIYRPADSVRKYIKGYLATYSSR